MKFWKLFENWNFEKLKFWKLNLKIGVLKIKLKIGVLEIIWKWKSWKLNLRIGILKNYLKMEVLEIKIEIWNFEKLFEKGSFEN